MANLNMVLLMGNLTRDPELRFTPSGQAVAQVGLAINRKYRDAKTNELREEVVFVDIEVWGKQAETVNQYLRKGNPAFFEGRLKLDQWDDKQTGQKRSKLKVIAFRMQFLGQPPSRQGAPAAPRPPQAARPAPTPAAAGAAPAAAPEAGAPPEPGADDLEMPEESVPF